MLIESLKSNWVADCPSRAPLYYQLYSALKRSITCGDIELGEQIPTVPQLSKALDVSRITVKRAMDELATEGLITRHRGKGSYVSYKYSSESIKAPLIGLSENLEGIDEHSLVKVDSVEKITPPAKIGKTLGLGKGQEAIKIVRTRYSEEKNIIAYYVSWTLPHFKGFTKCKVERQTQFSILSENDTSIAKVEQTIGARNADEFVANLLNVTVNAALLELSRSHFDKQGKLVDILIGLYNPHLFQYSMVLDG